MKSNTGEYTMGDDKLNHGISYIFHITDTILSHDLRPWSDQANF
jgi:hypothetical protein